MIQSKRKPAPRRVHQNPLIVSSPDIMSGQPVFFGTRVPIQTLWAYLEGGDPLEEFLRDFPGVSREHAVAVLELAKEKILATTCSPG